MVLSLICLMPFLAEFPLDVSGRVLNAIYHGDSAKALSCYLDYQGERDEHDYALLQQAGMALLKQGSESEDTQIQLMTLLGAGVSLCPPLVPILEKGVKSLDVRAQLAALNFLTQLNDDQADEIFLEALSSPFLLTRLEACFQLAQKNHPAVLEHLQSLIIKVPDPIRPLFAQIVVHLDSNSANQMMRQLLADRDLHTRCEAILAVAKEERDDFIPQIRMLATQTQVVQQECAAVALGALKDYGSIALLKELTASRQSYVSLAAIYALYQLGESRAAVQILERAKLDDLAALTLLGDIPTQEAEDLLLKKLQSADYDIQCNAALALLKRRDARAMPVLVEMLRSHQRDIGFIQQGSPGGGMRWIKHVTSASHKERLHPRVVQESVALRELVLTQALELEEEHFLQLASIVFTEKINPLVPLLVTLLCNHHSEKSIALLKVHAENPSPLISMYCNLALYKLDQAGPYAERLVAWVKEKQHTLLIRFREEVSEDRTSKHLLSPEEESRLLIETFETLAMAQNKAGLETLIHAIAYGNSQNRYALAGLLIRMTE